jgi:transposase
MSKYSASFKVEVVKEYRKNTRGASFRTLAKKYGIKGGAATVREWWLTWTRGGQTVESLEPRLRGHRRHKLTEKEEELIRDYVLQKNEEKKAVDYKRVHNYIVQKTKKDIAYSTIKGIGKELGISWKKTSRTLSTEGKDVNFSSRTFFFLGPSYEQQVIEFRKKCQRVDKLRLVFVDGSGMKAEPRPKYGLAPKGKKALVEAEKPEKWEPRLDFWGGISYNKPLAIDIMTSEDRRKLKVKGYGKERTRCFFKKKLAPKIASELKHIDVIICMDKGFKFTVEDIKKQFHLGGARNVKDAWIFPKGAGKLCNPLDNTLWHSLKTRVRDVGDKGELATAKTLKKEFLNISAKDIHAYYRHCSLTYGQDPHKDLKEI